MRSALTMVVSVALFVVAFVGVAPAQAHAGRTVIVSGNTTTLRDGSGWLATFTKGARTVTLRGARRTLREPGVSATVNSDVWVRELSAPFNGTVDDAWLDSALANTRPDVIATSLQYSYGAPTLKWTTGVRYAGDAHYGPPKSDGTRAEGSDFNDYMGVTWKYGLLGLNPDAPEPAEIGSLDCSGFIRMVFGYRAGIPLSVNPDGVRIPRRAHQIAASGPGVIITPNRGTQASIVNLRPGDLVFFDADTGDSTRVDHMGMFLGRDNSLRYRFISSRKKADGPTFGDAYARSIVDGTGLYARTFRSVRRL